MSQGPGNRHQRSAVDRTTFRKLLDRPRRVFQDFHAPALEAGPDSNRIWPRRLPAHSDAHASPCLAAMEKFSCRTDRRLRRRRPTRLIVDLSYVLFLHISLAEDQAVFWTVMIELSFLLALQLRDNALSQRPAELSSPLVERVDIPNDALGQNGFFVKGNEFTEHFWCEPFGKNRVRWPVTLEDAMRHQPVRRALSLHLFGRLAKR